MYSIADKKVLRELATKWMELANLPIMAERKRLWTALKDLKSQRPMILFESQTIQNFVFEDELVCKDKYLREVEKQLRWTIRHAEQIGDDIVVNPQFWMEWDIEISDYGVNIEKNSVHKSIGYSFNNPIESSEDILKLIPRTFKVNRTQTLHKKNLLEDIIGDIIPIKLHGTQCIFVGLTQTLFTMIGMEQMMLWLYDNPKALHQIMEYLCNDRINLYSWLVREKLAGLNSDSMYIGSGSPGFVSSLPSADFNGNVELKHLWVWMESQESVSISPSLFKDVFLPYMAKICKDFGLVYYGCCEPLHDRWQIIADAITNIRAVSVSPWSDLRQMGEMLGDKIVFSRKPNPAAISGITPDWISLRNDIKDTLNAAKNCNIEFIFRDVYDVNGDNNRICKWVEMARGLIQ